MTLTPRLAAQPGGGADPKAAQRREPMLDVLQAVDVPGQRVLHLVPVRESQLIVKLTDAVDQLII